MAGAAPLRPIAYGAPAVACDTAPDGTLHLRSTVALAPHDPSLARLFRAAVERNPSACSWPSARPAAAGASSPMRRRGRGSTRWRKG